MECQGNMTKKNREMIDEFENDIADLESLQQLVDGWNKKEGRVGRWINRAIKMSLMMGRIEVDNLRVNKRGPRPEFWDMF